MDAGLISLKVALTDDDGDGAADSIELGSLIKFEDDGPTILGIQETGPVAVGPDLIVNGSFEDGHGLTGADWEIYHAIPGWTSGDNGTPGNPNDDIPFEIQVGGVGGLPAQSGTALVELDSDTEGNPGNNSVGDIDQTSLTNTIIQQVVGGTIAGQTYELTFWYAPRADDGDADSSSMTVTWNGVLVHTINSANEPAGWQQITLQVTATGPNSVLGFGGTGQANELGAFIDNVSLRAMAVVLDDEDTDFGNDGISANDIGIQGGPGDDGQGVVENGQILFNAGSDGLKSIAPVALAGLSGVYVDPVTHLGTIHAITTAWVAGQNGAGGTAGYEKGGTLFGTMNVPSVGLVTAFTVEVQSDGTYKFTLLEPLAHPGHDDPSTNPAVESSFEDNLQLDFTVTVTDGDNDTATSTLSVNVDDDTPNLANVSFTLSDTMHDETAGVQNDPADLDAPLDTNVEHDVPVELTVFTDRTGAGEVLEFAGTAIGYAQNAMAAVVGVPVELRRRRCRRCARALAHDGWRRQLQWLSDQPVRHAERQPNLPLYRRRQRARRRPSRNDCRCGRSGGRDRVCPGARGQRYGVDRPIPGDRTSRHDTARRIRYASEPFPGRDTIRHRHGDRRRWRHRVQHLGFVVARQIRR